MLKRQAKKSLKKMNLQKIHDWFLANRRDFPWRKKRSPYQVLVSEIMLQQTQAERVIEYFSRWMEFFPDILSLSQAPEQHVIKAWEGLGYYSRARSLHRCARLIMEKHFGKIPKDEHQLLALPGIGPYTAGAIRCFAFHERAPAVDANVLRVLSRIYNRELFSHEATDILKKHLPKTSPWTAMEGLIELGALLCNRKPKCATCPFINSCQAYDKGTVHLIPQPKKQTKTTLWRDVAICLHENHVLIIHRKKQAIMQGLYEFPYFESKPGGRRKEVFQKLASQHFGHELHLLESFKPISHSFTRYQATLYPTLFSSLAPFSWPDGEWIQQEQLESLPFSSGHKRILRSLFSANFARL